MCDQKARSQAVRGQSRLMQTSHSGNKCLLVFQISTPLGLSSLSEMVSCWRDAIEGV